MKTLITPLLCAILTVFGCTEKRAKLSPAEKAMLPKMFTTAAPKPEAPLDIQFENKLTLMGYDVSTHTLVPGEPFTITWHWKVLKEIKPGWKLFTHIEDSAGVIINADDESLVRRGSKMSDWKPGQYVRDVQEIRLPADWKTKTAAFYVGAWQDDRRLRVIHGPSDGRDRARTLELDVDQSKQTALELPSTNAARAAQAPVIDGKLDDAIWKLAEPSRAFVDTMTGGPAPLQANVRLAWDDKNLYLAFDIKDKWLTCTHGKHDDHLWEQDVAEIMVDPDGDGQNYFELQASPTGLTFDTRYDSRRVPQPFGHVDWESNAIAKVATQGKVNDDEADQGYAVEWSIPWTAFAAGSTPAKAPKLNETWRFNFYILDALKQGQQAAAWSPPRVGDFHVPDRFGRITFVDTSKPAAAPKTNK